MLASRELEFKILQFVLSWGNGWRSAFLGTLMSSLTPHDRDSIVAALQRLHTRGRIDIQHLPVGGTRYVAYVRGVNDDLFYNGGFEIRVTAEGYSYCEELKAEGDNARRRLRAYLDTNVVSGLARADTSPEMRLVLDRLLEEKQQGKLELFTSELAKREINKIPDHVPEKVLHRVVASLLNWVPYVEDHDLRGIRSEFSAFGQTSSPILETKPVSLELLRIGLDQTDAHHVMLAIEADCDVFVTWDRKTILKHRAKIEPRFDIRLMSPEEFFEEFLAVVRN